MQFIAYHDDLGTGRPAALQALDQSLIDTAKDHALRIGIPLRGCKPLENLIAVAQIERPVDAEFHCVGTALPDKYWLYRIRWIFQNAGKDCFLPQGVKQLPCKQGQDISDLPVFQIQNLGVGARQDIRAIAALPAAFQHRGCAEDFRFLPPHIARKTPV